MAGPPLQGSFSAGCQGAVLCRECPSHCAVPLGADTTPLPSLRDTVKSLLRLLLTLRAAWAPYHPKGGLVLSLCRLREDW